MVTKKVKPKKKTSRLGNRKTDDLVRAVREQLAELDAGPTYHDPVDTFRRQLLEQVNMIGIFGEASLLDRLLVRGALPDSDDALVQRRYDRIVESILVTLRSSSE